MKKLLLLFVAVLTLASCDLDDDNNKFSYEFLPVEEAVVPEDMVVGEVYEITMEYMKPNACYTFDTLYYDRSKETENVDDEDITTEVRTVAVITRKAYTTDSECGEIDDMSNVSFDFAPRTSGPYLFKFWNGEDEDGEDTFLEYPVVIAEK
ncbi:membrane lipoprotein lipid attachment site-containing protein [Formosa haliotis]|uniref:membrane lipoprotein lipid attachment site-containing protein n=1 Tax=Formosa haliotis TaxID=1555194 RepID=UPI0008258452|nr:membrane lipoprotein lipid attachment site-containing protein [Formosa haliotis]